MAIKFVLVEFVLVETVLVGDHYGKTIETLTPETMISKEKSNKNWIVQYDKIDFISA